MTQATPLLCRITKCLQTSGNNRTNNNKILLRIYAVILAQFFFFNRFIHWFPDPTLVLSDIVPQIEEDLDSIRAPNTNFDNGLVGGVVLFYHVSKTGGSTIREFFMQQPEQYFYYKRIMHRVDKHNIANTTSYSHENRAKWFTNPDTYCVPNKYMEQKMSTVHNKVKKTLRSQVSTERTLLLEFHGNFPSLRNLTPFIKKWRKLSQAHNKTFFAFTIVRDPLPYSISYFKYFHLNCKSTFCERERYSEMTEDNLLLSVKSNPQCFFLTHLSSTEKMHPSFYDKCRVFKDDCKNMYNMMQENLDWVGTTENISFDTIPLLSYLLKYDNNTKIENKKMQKNQGLKTLKLNTTLQIRARTELDQEIYENVRDSYTIDKRFPGLKTKIL